MKIEEYKGDYLFTKDDEENLGEVWAVLQPYMDEFVSDFLVYLKENPETVQFFRTPEASDKREATMKSWTESLLNGPFDNRYLNKLRHIGLTHVKKGIPIHWVTASMNYKREYIGGILQQEIEESGKLHALEKSLDKILDINLDVMSSSYHEEEIKRRFLSERMDSTLISFAERVSYGMNVVLVLALIGLSFGVIALFASEILELFRPGSSLGGGIIAALGTLLIIWVIIELIGTEIKYLKGQSFHMKIFISVALVAFIRELLVLNLAEKPVIRLGVMLAAVLVLGIVYYLISRIDTKL